MSAERGRLIAGNFPPFSVREIFVPDNIIAGKFPLHVSETTLQDSNPTIDRTKLAGAIFPKPGDACTFIENLPQGTYKRTIVEQLPKKVDPIDGNVLVDRVTNPYIEISVVVLLNPQSKIGLSEEFDDPLFTA